MGIGLPIERCPQGGVLYRQIVTRLRWEGRVKRGGEAITLSVSGCERGGWKVVGDRACDLAAVGFFDSDGVNEAEEDGAGFSWKGEGEFFSKCL